MSPRKLYTVMFWFNPLMLVFATWQFARWHEGHGRLDLVCGVVDLVLFGVNAFHILPTWRRAIRKLEGEDG